LKFILLPFAAWIIAGCLKFAINTIRSSGSGRALIGYGGFPSTHTTIISAVVFLAGFTDGFGTPIFSIGMGILLLVVIDAHGLRNKVGAQAKILNGLQDKIVLRERMGHTWWEIGGGLLLGLLLAWIMAQVDF
jgi:acid phosphatase family membrane protein YuiD